MIRAHRNLHSLKPGSKANPWSYYGHGAKRVMGAHNMVLFDVVPKQPSGKAFDECLAGTGYRAVFAWLKCERAEIDSLRVWEWEANLEEGGSDNPRFDLHGKPIKRLRFNPKNGDKFFHVDGKRFDGAETVWLLSNGEAYAFID